MELIQRITFKNLQKTNFHYEKSQAKYQQYVESNTKHFQDWQREGYINLKKMRKDLDHLGEKYFNYYDQYEKIKMKYYTIGDKHHHMINVLKGVSKCIYSNTWVKRPFSKRPKNWVSRPIMAWCRSKV